MKFDPIPPFVCVCALGFIGGIFYLIAWDDLPELLQNTIKEHFWIWIVFSIPFLIWMGFNKTDKEWKDYLEKEEKKKKENNEIIKKYEAMPDLNNATRLVGSK